MTQKASFGPLVSYIYIYCFYLILNGFYRHYGCYKGTEGSVEDTGEENEPKWCEMRRLGHSWETTTTTTTSHHHRTIRDHQTATYTARCRFRETERVWWWRERAQTMPDALFGPLVSFFFPHMFFIITKCYLKVTIQGSRCTGLEMLMHLKS